MDRVQWSVPNRYAYIPQCARGDGAISRANKTILSLRRLSMRWLRTIRIIFVFFWSMSIDRLNAPAAPIGLRSAVTIFIARSSPCHVLFALVCVSWSFLNLLNTPTTCIRTHIPIMYGPSPPRSANKTGACQMRVYRRAKTTTPFDHWFCNVYLTNSMI